MDKDIRKIAELFLVECKLMRSWCPVSFYENWYRLDFDYQGYLSIRRRFCKQVCNKVSNESGNCIDGRLHMCPCIALNCDTAREKLTVLIWG